MAGFFIAGHTLGDLHEFYPHLSEEDIAAAITYFDTHREEILALIAHKEAIA